MALILSLIVLNEILFGVTFLDRKPDKPGFYTVQFDEDGDFNYVPLKELQKSKEKLSATSITAYDFRLARGKCRAINAVRDQKQCGGCWAFSSTDAFGAALCLRTNQGQDKTFSPQYMIDCPDKQKWPDTSSGHEYTQQGCQGGYPIVAFQTFVKYGVPTWDCLPYTGTNHSCPAKCSDGTSDLINTTLNKKTKATGATLVDAYKVSVQELRDLVTTSGPCVAEMKVYSDLSSYKFSDGVYETKKSGEKFEGHAITIYGFGTEGTGSNAKNYWLVKNSWGSNWPQGCSGDDCGFFKIRMGLNESGIEDNFYALWDNRNGDDYSTELVPRPTQTEPGPYWDFEDKPNCPIISSKALCTATSGCSWEDKSTSTTETNTHNAQTHFKAHAHTQRLRSKNSKVHRLENVECYDYTNNNTCLAASGCVWFDFTNSPFCDDWDYDCASIVEDDYFDDTVDTCASFGDEFGLECDLGSDGKCFPVNCNDAKKKAGCDKYPDECQWFDYSDDYYPFCDEKGWKCSDFDKNTCTYSTVYGLQCETSGNDCVSTTSGNCVNVDAASGRIVPTLTLLVMFLLFVAFL